MTCEAVQVEHLWKQYRLGQIGSATLREDVQRTWARLAGRPDPLLKVDETASPDSVRSIWALSDVSFAVREGDAVAIIGRNGAGKSTLLKVMSRITAPTRGVVRLRGRLASLLEVGTGFHPDLTGRQNVHLNGAILGMRAREIAHKMDDIISFAELERFADTPVKRYSSGMYVRLAFAVAAHLDPEILIVDEVLAVGDLAFQKRCLGKMGEVARSGRTVLFVSHNMLAVTSLCERAIWLDAGRVRAEGQASGVVAEYVSTVTCETSSFEELWTMDAESAPASEEVALRRIAIVPGTPQVRFTLGMDTPFRVVVEFVNRRAGARLHVSVVFYTDQELPAFTTWSAVTPEWRNRPLRMGLYRATCFVPGNLLNSGRHRIVVYVIRDLSWTALRYDSSVRFDIVDLERREGGWMSREPGVVQPRLSWENEFLGGG